MAKYEAKTKETANSVHKFIDSIPDEQKQKDAKTLVELMEELSGFEAKMWGPSIIGFGSYHYVYESGHEGDAPRLGFSPRKAEMVLYMASGFPQFGELLGQFGKHKKTKGCIYFKRLEDVSIPVLKKMIKGSLKYMKEKYP